MNFLQPLLQEKQTGVLSTTRATGALSTTIATEVANRSISTTRATGVLSTTIATEVFLQPELNLENIRNVKNSMLTFIFVKTLNLYLNKS